jgi:hypothetical protein
MVCQDKAEDMGIGKKEREGVGYGMERDVVK